MGNVQPVTRSKLVRWKAKVKDSFAAAPKENAEFKRSVLDLGGYTSFEDCSLSEGKKENTERHPLISSSPAWLERPVRLDESGSGPSPRKSLDADREEEDHAKLPEIKPIDVFNGFRHLSPVPSEKITEYKLRLKSEMAKVRGIAHVDMRLDGYYDLSFKNVNGFVQVKFGRRFTGGGVRIDKEVLVQAIQRAEHLVMLPPIAEIGSDPRNRIVVKRSTEGEKGYIEFVNVPKKSSIAVAVGKLLLHFVRHMFEGECLAFGSTQEKSKLHSFRTAPLGDKHAAFDKIDLVDFEDLVVRTAAEKISLLETDGIDIHICDADTVVKKVLPSMSRDLSEMLSIDFTSGSTVPMVTLDD